MTGFTTKSSLSNKAAISSMWNMNSVYVDLRYDGQIIISSTLDNKVKITDDRRSAMYNRKQLLSALNKIMSEANGP